MYSLYLLEVFFLKVGFLQLDPYFFWPRKPGLSYLPCMFAEQCP
jgi:hypothetical protein